MVEKRETKGGEIREVGRDLVMRLRKMVLIMVGWV